MESQRRVTYNANMKTIYSLNENAFTTLTDDTQRYWLGFLLGDGCVFTAKYKSGTQYMLILALSEYDRGHVEAFRSFLTSSHPIRTVRLDKGGPASRLTISNKPLVQSLARFGIVRGKTNSAAVAPELAHSAAFWRGLIDADGSLYWCNLAGQRPVPRVELVGTRAVCDAFSVFIREGIGATVTPRKMKSIWSASIAGKRAVELVNLLYTDGPSLPRKKTLAAEFRDTYGTTNRSYFDWSKVSSDTLTSMHARLGTWAAVAKDLGVSYPALAAARQGRSLRK